MNGGDRVERRRRRFATFVAEPAAPLELGLDRSEALGALWMLAGLVPMKSDADQLKQTALYVTIGFLAGFTERFAQDMFVRSGNGLQGVMGDSPSTGPSAGLAPPPGAQPGGAPAA